MSNRVSFIESYAGFRVFFWVLWCLTFPMGYSIPTFAADFRVFKSMITHIFTTIGQVTTHLSGHVTGIGIHVPQRCIEMGITSDVGEGALLALQNFVGQRPITCAQGFSHPFST